MENIILDDNQTSNAALVYDFLKNDKTNSEINWGLSYKYKFDYIFSNSQFKEINVLGENEFDKMFAHGVDRLVVGYYADIQEEYLIRFIKYTEYTGFPVSDEIKKSMNNQIEICSYYKNKYGSEDMVWQ